MTISKRMKQILPFFILFTLLSLLGRELFSATPTTTAMTGEPLPSFNLPLISNPDKRITENMLVGQVSLLNIWASWCGACHREHDMLMKIHDQYHIPIYGILYKDNAEDATKFLQRNGNPYVTVGNDTSGDVGVELGIYGTPETYVINPQGKIVYRQVGIIDQDIWDNVLYPIVKRYQRAG